MSRSLAIGWYGKLPCAGDFVHRRLAFPLIEAMDRWLRNGLTQLRGVRPSDWQAAYKAAPMWNFALPRSVNGECAAFVGLMAPSRDRVGREFPLCAGVAVPVGLSPGPVLADSHEWLSVLGRVVVNAQSWPTTVDAFDVSVQAIPLPEATAGGSPDGGGADILEILGPGPDDVSTVPMALAHALPWPDLPRQFDPEGPTSYWWTNAASGVGLRGFASDAGLAPSLLPTLLQPLPGTIRSRA